VILGFREESLKRRVDFLIKSAGLTLADFAKDLVMFGYSSEKRVIPRYRVTEALKSMRVLETNMHLRQILRMTEKRFLEIYVDSNAKSFRLLDIYHC